MPSVQKTELGGGIALVVVAAACIGALIYLLLPRKIYDPGAPPPIPQYAPEAPPGTVTDATAFSSDNPFGIKPAEEFVCQTPAAAAGAAGAAAGAAAPPAFLPQSTCPGEAGSPGPAFGQSSKCPQPSVPAPEGGPNPASHAFASTGYGYCTGVPGGWDSGYYRDWVKFYDDPQKTGATFTANPGRDYNRVGNITGAGCLVSPDSGKTNANYSRSPYMQTMMLGDEPVLYDMLTRSYPAGPGALPGTGGPQGQKGFPRLTPIPTPQTRAATFGYCVEPDGARCSSAPDACPGQSQCRAAAADRTTPAGVAIDGTICTCTCRPPCGEPGVCVDPPCPVINCDASCNMTATVSATPLASATFASDGGYGQYIEALHKIWGWTPKFEMGGVNASNVYPFKAWNYTGDALRSGEPETAEPILPGDPMYNCNVLRHRLTGDYAPLVDTNTDRDGGLPPGVPNALDFHSAWVRPKGYEANSDADYQEARTKCGECGPDGKACFSELACKNFDTFDPTKPLSVVYQGSTIETFYRNPPQLPIGPNPPVPPVTASDKACRAYPASAGGKNPRARCGGCSATAQAYGPGRYTARARLMSTNPQTPKLLDMTDPDNPRGRGYVFAMWTFAYAEVYAIGSDPETDPDFVVSDQATTSAPCWDDCSCLTSDRNFCQKSPEGMAPDTCCDPRVARSNTGDRCTSPQAFTPASAGTPALYVDPSAGTADSNVLTPASCAISPPTADPHTSQTIATEGGCYIANEDIDCWVGDPDNQTDPNDKGNCGVTFCSAEFNPRGDRAKPGKAKGPWLNAGPCLKALNTFEGGRSQPNAVNAVSKDWVLKINGKAPPYAPYTTVCSGFKVYTSINSEIDIEIPANSPQLDWTTHLNFNTMNANTWAFDIDSYQGYKPFYSQAMVQALPKQMPAAGVDGPPTAQPTFVDNRYHDYMIDWYVDDDHSKSYVAFYFDGALIYSTQRFVPTRTGRLLWGLWPGWWGTGRQLPDFDFGYADLAGLIIEPYTPVNSPDVKIRTMPQTYDQVIPAGVDQAQCCPFSGERYKFKGETQCKSSQPCELACDFRPIPASVGAVSQAKVFACVDGVCRALGDDHVAPAGAGTYPGDPFCGGQCGTCIGCVKTPPPPPDPKTFTWDRTRFTYEVLLYFGACVTLVAGALLLGSASARAGQSRTA
jgi:hypothetical protein